MYSNFLSSMRANEDQMSTIPEDIRTDFVSVGENKVTLIEPTISHNSLECLSNAIDCNSQRKIYPQASTD